MSCVSVWRWCATMTFVLCLVPAVVSAESVAVEWDPSEGATGYTLRWGTAPGSYPNSADAGNSTTFIITGLTAGKTYWAVVQAYNATEVSGYSNVLEFTVPGTTPAPAPAPCSYSINPGAATVAYGAATGVIDVATQAGCAWTASSASSFLTFSNGSGRTGPGTVTYSIAANSTTSARIGTATVAGKAFSVSQAAAPPSCTYSISPGNASVTAGATTGTIAITTQTDCAWTASSNSSFLTFDNAIGRKGSGVVTYAVTANTGTTTRSAAATVAGKAFALSQSAPPQNCTYSISPSSTTVPAAAGGGSFTVTTQAGCAWTATSTSSFLTFPNGTGRTGSGSLNFSVTENTDAFRTGRATVAGKSLTVYQLAPACSFTVDPERSTVPAAAGTLMVNVTTQSGCTWNAQSMSSYITITNGSAHTGSGSVALAVSANTGTTSRTGISAIAGTTVYVTQSAPAVEPPPADEPPASPWSSDFDHDGKNDLLLQETATGAVEAWLLDNAMLKGKQALSDTMDANWGLVGRGDFNADGKPDLVWQHKVEGTIYLWYMNGTMRIGVASPSISTPGDPRWKVVGVGDFNKDGKPDLAWQHAGDGTLAVWIMNGATVSETVNLVPNGVTDPLWKAVGVGDFNGDGNSDLLWRHMGTGSLTTWLMNGLSRIISAPLSPMTVRDQGWQIGAVVDANGDGKPDIVWEHTDGTIMIWHMNGTSRSTYPTVPVPVTPGWHLVGPK